MSPTRFRDPIKPLSRRGQRHEDRAGFLESKGFVDVVRHAVDAPPSPTTTSPWKQQPWLTPILGSGPLGLPLDFLRVADRLPGLIGGLVAHHDLFSPFQGLGADPAMWSELFVRELVAQRCGTERALDRFVPTAGSVVVDDAELLSRLQGLPTLLLVVAAQSTRTFHRMSLDTCRPLSRWGSERSLMHSSHDRWQGLQDEYVRVLRAAAGAADVELTRLIASVRPTRAAGAASAPAGGVETATTLRAIRALIKSVSAQFLDSEGVITLLHLQQLTEAAWFILVDRVSGDAYPGWTDLLLRLLLRDEGGVQPGHRRPRSSHMETVAKDVAEIMLPASLAAWTAPVRTAEGQENFDFYNSVADSLWAQHRAREAWYSRDGGRDEAGDLPQVIAFVSSFDYELETALWRQAAESGGTFSVIIPVYAVPQGNQQEVGDFVWLEGIISVPQLSRRGLDNPTAEQFHQQLLRPTSWQVVSSRRDHRHARHPVVVRLSGCPLIPLPSLSGPQGSALRNDLAGLQLTQVESLVHSVTVDEFLALRQTEADWVWSTSEAKSNEAVSRALPNEFVGTSEKAAERYWAIMGVPFRDPAVRIRLLSVLVRPAESASPSGAKVTIVDAPVGDPTPPPPTDKAAELAAPARAIRPRLGAPAAQPALITPARSAPSPAPANGPGPATQSVPGQSEEEPVAGSQRRTHHRHGVAINTRVDDEEALLLEALGFTVVRDRCENFTRDLEDYAAWLTRLSTEIHQLDRLEKEARA